MHIKRGAVACALWTFTWMSPAIASNGTHNSSLSPAAAGMAGVSVGGFVSETESLFRNPALVGDRLTATGKPDAELSAVFGKHNSQGALSNGTADLPSYEKSKDSLMVLPNAAVAVKITDNVAAGLGWVTYGGSTLDYTGITSLSEQKSDQQLFRLLPAVAATPVDGVKLGAALVVGYSTVKINSGFQGAPQDTLGVKSAWGMGGLFGVNVTPTKGVHLGATYLTRTQFKFKEVFNVSQLGPAPTTTLNDVTIHEPAEWAAGIAYEVDDWTLFFDFRRIGWANASTYSELGWQNQSVFAVGAQYKSGLWTFRAGVNYGKSPIQNATDISGDDMYDFQGTTVLKGAVTEMNLIGFTAITEWEGDIGAGYRVTDQLSVDFAFNYVPSKTITQSGTMTLVAGSPPAPFIVSSKASEWGVVAGVSYQF